MNRLTLLLIWLACSLTSHAQFTLSIFDLQTTAPLSGAQVTCEWVDPKTARINKQLAYTNAQGKCELDEQAIKNQANFTIFHQFVGESKWSAYAIIERNYKLYLSLKTRPLDEVVISSEKTQETVGIIPRQIDVISSQTIRFSNQQNTADLLLKESNVFIQKSQQGGGSPIIRGFEANRIVLVVDGIRLNNAIFRAGHLQNVIRVDQNVLEQAEVLYGAGGVMYGSDALGGVILLSTKAPKLNSISSEFYTRFSSANHENTNHIQLNIGRKKWASFTAITHSNFGNITSGRNRDAAWQNVGLRPYFIKRINGVDTEVRNPNPYEQVESNYKQTDFLQKFTFAPLHKKYQLDLNVQYSTTGNIPRYDRLTDVNSVGKLSAAQWYYGPEQRLLAAAILTIQQSTVWYDRLKISLAYQKIGESRHNRNSGSDWLNHRIEEVNVLSTTLDAYKKISKHNLHYGLDVQLNNVNSSAYASNVNNDERKAISTRYPAAGSQQHFAAAFVTHSWQLHKAISWYNGLRFTYTVLRATFGESKDFYTFLPERITQSTRAITFNSGMNFKLSKTWRSFINVSSGFRSPNVDDINKIFDSRANSVILPNPNLKPEQSLTPEVGINYSFKDKIHLQATVYTTYLTNAIIVSPTQINGNDSIWYDGNNAKAHTLLNAQQALIYGYHSSLKWDMGTNYHLYTAFTSTHGRVTAPSNSPLDHIPPVYGRTGITYKTKGIVVDANVVYCGAKNLADYSPSGEDNLQYATSLGLPAWYTLNLKAQYSLYKRKTLITIQVGIDNILDTHYRLFASGISAMGRNIYATLRFKI